MTDTCKISLKNLCFVVIPTAFCMIITCAVKAEHTKTSEIYSSLTTDTIPVRPIGQISPRNRADTSLADSIVTRETISPDTILPRQTIDTFSLRFSKDTLDAPVDYEAADSGVLLVREKKFLLYGNTKTSYKDITLTAPEVEFDQATNILTAVRSADSLGNTITRAYFQQGAQNFQSDTIRFNFKTRKGITTNTYTQQGDGMFVSGERIKKVDEHVAFIKRVVFTTCSYTEPHFGFRAGKGKFVTNKVAVTGPIHPEFEGVPVPLYLPFGMFPLTSGRHSGFLPPQFTVNQDFGLGLEGLGYYHVVNDYVDVTVRGNVYSYGGWSANILPTYRKRYRYQGSFNAGLQHTKFNFKGDPDYQLRKTFTLSWAHNVDPRARPGTVFSANVNVSSTRYNELIPTAPNRNVMNMMNSSIRYSKTWDNSPFNLTISGNHSQNNLNRIMTVSLPEVGFTMTTIYPFQKKEVIGAPRWYEKIGVGYTGAFKNFVAFDDTESDLLNKILDTMQWGAQHRFPINVSLPPLGPVLVAPFLSYEETWLTRRIGRSWNDAAQKIDTIYDKEGLFIDRQLSFGVGLNTALYGTYQFKKGKVIAIRHVVRPNVNVNYKPNLSKKYYDLIRTQPGTDRVTPIAQFSGANLFSGYGYGEFGGLTFGLDNNIEMKVRNKKDSANGTKKVRLIDGFGFTSAYNFLEDSMRLQPFNLYLRTTLFEKLSITGQAVYNPYERDSLGNYIDRFMWQGDRFRLGRINSGSIAISSSFQSKPRDPQKSPKETPVIDPNNPNYMAERERMQDYMRRNPAEFVDFNIPWSLTFSYTLAFREIRRPDNSFGTDLSSSVSFSNSFSLTPKWNFSTSGFYDFDTKRMTMFTMSVSRDMHCWQMSVNITPIGNYRYFNITINPKSPLLQDLRVNRTRYFYNY